MHRICLTVRFRHSTESTPQWKHSLLWNDNANVSIIDSDYSIGSPVEKVEDLHQPNRTIASKVYGVNGSCLPSTYIRCSLWYFFSLHSTMAADSYASDPARLICPSRQTTGINQSYFISVNAHNISHEEYHFGRRWSSIDHRPRRSCSHLLNGRLFWYSRKKHCKSKSETTLYG